MQSSSIVNLIGKLIFILQLWLVTKTKDEILPESLMLSLFWSNTFGHTRCWHHFTSLVSWWEIVYIDRIWNIDTWMRLTHCVFLISTLPKIPSGLGENDVVLDYCKDGLSVNAAHTTTTTLQRWGPIRCLGWDDDDQREDGEWISVGRALSASQASTHVTHQPPWVTRSSPLTPSLQYTLV